MDRGEKMVKIEAQPKQLYKHIRPDIADLKIKLVFLFLYLVQKGSCDV